MAPGHGYVPIVDTYKVALKISPPVGFKADGRFAYLMENSLAVARIAAVYELITRPPSTPPGNQ